MARFRKKPIVIEAEQFLEGKAIPKGVCFGWKCDGPLDDSPHLHTIHDNQRVDIVFGDWVIPESDGEHFYPCKDSIFQATYEAVAPENSIRCDVFLCLPERNPGHYVDGRHLPIAE